MAQFQVNPVELISAPNYYSYLPDQQWVITGGSMASLAGQLWIQDSLGNRRYVMPTTASLTIMFLRADSPAIPSAAQSVLKMPAINAQDRSLFTFTLTAQDATQIISGSVIFTLTDTVASNPQATFVKNYGVKKLIVGPGY